MCVNLKQKIDIQFSVNNSLDFNMLHGTQAHSHTHTRARKALRGPSECVRKWQNKHLCSKWVKSRLLFSLIFVFVRSLLLYYYIQTGQLGVCTRREYEKTDFVLTYCFYCIIIRRSISIARVEAAPAAPSVVCVHHFAIEIVSISFEIKSFDCEQFSWTVAKTQLSSFSVVFFLLLPAFISRSEREGE